jgi:hypothetical protein
MLQIVELNRHKKADRKRFIRLPFSIYRNDPNWVAPLNMAQHLLLTNKEPFYEHGETQLYMAVRDGRDVGRIAAIENKNQNQVHNDKVGFAGFFECEDNVETASALFDVAGKWIRGRGLDTMRGPINLSTNHTIGLFVLGEDGPPIVDMTYNPKYYEKLFVSYQFAKVMDVVAYKLDVTTPSTMERLRKMAERVKRKEGITTRTIDMKQFPREVKILKEIYNNAWEKNWGFIPLSDKEFDHSAEDLKLIVDPALIHFVFVDGKPAAFQATIPNINEILIKLHGRLFPFGIFRLMLGKTKVKSLRLMLTGVCQEFRHRGIDPLLYYQSLHSAIAHNYTMCESSWLLETNTAILRASEFMGGYEYRRYRIYDKKL